MHHLAFHEMKLDSPSPHPECNGKKLVGYMQNNDTL